MEKEDGSYEKLLKTTRHKKCNEGTAKGHEEMCDDGDFLELGVSSIYCDYCKKNLTV